MNIIYKKIINLNAQKKRILKNKYTREHEIQLAARKIFFKNSFVASTIEEISKQAKVSVGTIYRYYKNKEDLYISLASSGTLKIGDGLIRLESEIDHKTIKSGRDIIMKIFDIYYRYYQKDPDASLVFATLQSSLFAKVSARNLQITNEAARRNFSTTRRIIAKGKEQGFFKPHLSEHIVADALWSTFLGLVIVEENKKRITYKDHIYSTVSETFSLLAEAICL